VSYCDSMDYLHLEWIELYYSTDLMYHSYGMRVILDSPSDVRLHDQLDSYCLDRRMGDRDESVALEGKLV
jgi:hypothetical protein